MSDQVDDPAVNFVLPPQRPLGMRIPEFIFRQLIGYGLQRIRDAIGTPDDIIDELFAMLTVELRGQIREWLLNHKSMWLDVSWPRDDVSLPMIVVEPHGEDQPDDLALLGDLAGTTDVGVHGALMSSLHHVIPERHTTNIYVGAQDDRLALVLYNIVKFLLVNNKQELTKWYDVHNLRLGGQALTMDESQLPTFGYFRVMTLTYECMFDFNGVEQAAKILKIELDMQTTQDGQPVTVPVPSEP